MKFKREQLFLYAVTDSNLSTGRNFFEMAEEALKGGVTMLQLREKNLDKYSFTEKALELKKICCKYEVPLIVDDNIEVALKSGADGVHVGANDISVAEARKIAGIDFIIGATAKTVEQAKRAEREGADYLGVGAVFPSPTKKNAIRIDKIQLQDICGSVDIPAVAIGGITSENICELSGSNIAGVAVVSALFAKEDVFRATKEMKEACFRAIL